MLWDFNWLRERTADSTFGRISARISPAISSSSTTATNRRRAETNGMPSTRPRGSFPRCAPAASTSAPSAGTAVEDTALGSGFRLQASGRVRGAHYGSSCDSQDGAHARRDSRRARAAGAHRRAAARVLSGARREHDAGGLRRGPRDVVGDDPGRRTTCTAGGWPPTSPPKAVDRPREGMPRAHIVYFHGNGGNLSIWAPILAGVARRGYTVTAFDYRGYGNSTGRPGESGLYRDVDAVLERFWSGAAATGAGGLLGPVARRGDGGVRGKHSPARRPDSGVVFSGCANTGALVAAHGRAVAVLDVPLSCRRSSCRRSAVRCSSCTETWTR